MSRKMICGFVFVVAVSLLVGGNVRAAVLYYEGFDYTPGSVNTAGTAWDHEYAPSVTTPTFEAGSLTYPLLATTGNRLAQNDPDGAQSPFTSNDTTSNNAMFSVAGTYYYTMLGRIQSDIDGLEGLGSPSTYADPGFAQGYIQLAAQANGGDEISFAMEVGGPGGATSLPYTPAIVYPGTFMFAVKVVNDGGAGLDQVYLKVNPDLSQSEAAIFATPTLSVTNRNITSPVSANAQIYFGRDHEWDEIRVATTWAEAAPAIPEPASLSLLAVCCLGLLRRRSWKA